MEKIGKIRQFIVSTTMPSTTEHVYIVYENTIYNIDKKGATQKIGDFGQYEYALCRSGVYQELQEKDFIFKEFWGKIGITADTKSSTCTCERQKLINSGCSCGAFQRELKDEII